MAHFQYSVHRLGMASEGIWSGAYIASERPWAYMEVWAKPPAEFRGRAHALSICEEVGSRKPFSFWMSNESDKKICRTDYIWQTVFNSISLHLRENEGCSLCFSVKKNQSTSGVSRWFQWMSVPLWWDPWHRLGLCASASALHTLFSLFRVIVAVFSLCIPDKLRSRSAVAIDWYGVVDRSPTSAAVCWSRSSV